MLGLDAIQSKVDQVNGGDVATSRTSRRSASARSWRRATSAPRPRGTSSAPWTPSSSACPTPLTEHREPDLSAVLGAAESLAAAPAPGHLVVLESTTYPGTTRDEVAPVLERSGLQRRPRLPPGLLARARRPGPHRLDHGHHAEGDRRAHARVHAPRDGALRPGLRDAGAGRQPRGGRAHQAAREHLPQRQHRPRQRAGDALRPHGHRRLGRHRRGGDQALRLHAVPARARASAATASRSTPSTSRGRRASSTSTPSSSSSPARSTRRCRASASPRSSRALNSRRKALNGSRVLVIGVAYKAERQRHAREPGAAHHRAAAGRRRQRRLPRPARARRCRSSGWRASRSTPDSAREYDVVVVVTAHAGIDWDDGRRIASSIVDLRNVVPEHRRQGLEALIRREPR